MAQTLFRILKGRQPVVLDFLSLEEQGLARESDDVEMIRLQSGILCWATEAQARRASRRFPALGSYIARLELPDDAAVRIERTRGPGHHTVWGEPETLITFVIAVTPV